MASPLTGSEHRRCRPATARRVAGPSQAGGSCGFLGRCAGRRGRARSATRRARINANQNHWNAYLSRWLTSSARRGSAAPARRCSPAPDPGTAAVMYDAAQRRSAACCLDPVEVDAGERQSGPPLGDGSHPAAATRGPRPARARSRSAGRRDRASGPRPVVDGVAGDPSTVDDDRGAIGEGRWREHVVAAVALRTRLRKQRFAGGVVRARRLDRVSGAGGDSGPPARRRRRRRRRTRPVLRVLPCSRRCGQAARSRARRSTIRGDDDDREAPGDTTAGAARHRRGRRLVP